MNSTLQNNLNDCNIVLAVSRGEKTRKEFAVLLCKQRAAITIQKQIKAELQEFFFRSYECVDSNNQLSVAGLSEIALETLACLIWETKRETDEVLVKASYLAELQQRVLKAEAALQEKEEENEILHQRLRQYENRWSEYELKMKSMEEVWQKQMRSLQSSLSIAKRSLAVDDLARNSDA